MCTKLSCLFALVVLSLTAPLTARAQERGDSLFPAAGSASLTFATGVPFLAIQEAAIGLTSHVAVGAVVGVTPKGAGFGFRPRGALELGSDFRLTLVVPTFYYPSTSQSMDWFLTRPTLMLEHRFDSGVRMWALAGAIVAFCADDVLGSHAGNASGDEVHGFWIDAGLGASVPLSARTTAFGEVALVFDDQGLTKRVLSPVVVVLGANVQF